jgi:hypothetical protein
MRAITVITHSAINWSQLIATIVTLLTGIGLISAFISNRIEKYRQRNADQTDRTIRAVTEGLARRQDDVDEHLEAQDRQGEQLNNRLWRIEQYMMAGPRRWFRSRQPKE